MTITYKVKNGIYVNMTNRCNCSCTFCLRHNGPGIFGSDPLWLDHEPSVDEVVADFAKWNLEDYDEVVFCGYGEPTERLDDLLKVAEFIKSKRNIPIRINTNGLANLLYNEDVTPKFKGLIDSLSISLNATNAEDYLKMTRNGYGIQSYEAMKDFARLSTKYVPNVMMTVVDKVTSPEEQEEAKKICESLGVTLRVRPFES